MHTVCMATGSADADRLLSEDHSGLSCWAKEQMVEANSVVQLLLMKAKCHSAQALHIRAD